MEKKVKCFFYDLWQTILSFVKIVLLSRGGIFKPTACSISVLRDASSPFTTQADLVILANGPSLADTINQHSDFLKTKTLWAVNHAVQSDAFLSLRPQFYLLADPLFWIVPEIRERTFSALKERVSWQMTLFMPVRAYKNKQWQPLLQGNSNIKVERYNSTPVEGFSFFAHYAYSRGLGMPRPHNVLITSLSVALRMPFQRIYIAGADHSWLGEISVNDNNEVLMNQKHFYDANTSQAKTVKNEDLTDARLHVILAHMSTAFRSYWLLRKFSESIHKSVINITPNSFIDAFSRQTI